MSPSAEPVSQGLNARPADTGVSTTTEHVTAALVGLVTFCVYLATIYPGLLDIGDATKFAFVGKVLGTPHAPGYPLYVLVSHLFSYVPWGTLAYRMNVLSALFGAVTVGLGYLIARRMGVGRAAAISTAFALGLGQAFWAKALYAKGYTLNAALVSAGVLMLLRWNDRRHASDLYWAVAIFALSIGNHLTVLALLPALALFSVWTDPRTALRPKTILIVLLMVVLGLSQYGLIIVRTLQHAPYLEARASNLQELWAVMTARRFAHEIGAYSVSTLMSTRVPIVAGLIGTELGPMGIFLLCVGLSALFLRQRRHAVLFGLGALGVASLTANMSSEEDQGFLLSVFVLLWPVAGVGLQYFVAALQRAPRRLASALAFGIVVLLPSSQIVTNYRLNDHHTETFETDYFNALFAALPQKSAIVNDEYRLNMLVLYKLLGERAAGARDIRLVSLDKDAIARLRKSGFDVFAFQSARKDLAEFGFNFAPFNIPARGEAEAVVRLRDIFRVVSTPVCLDIGNQGWLDITTLTQPKGRMNVRIDDYRPFDAELIVYAGADQPLSPALVAAQGRGTPSLEVQVFTRSDVDARKRLATSLAADKIGLPQTVLEAPFVVRARVHVNDEGASSSFALDLGGQTAEALGRARVDQDSPRRATVCTHPLGDADVLPLDATRAVFSPDANDVQFDSGWYPTERRSDGFTYRWTTNRAVLEMPIDHPRATTVEIEAEPLSYEGRREGAMTLVVNRHRLDPHRLPNGRTTLSWNVPIEYWREGLNELVFEIDGATSPLAAGLSPDKRILGVSVTQIELKAVDPLPH